MSIGNLGPPPTDDGSSALARLGTGPDRQRAVAYHQTGHAVAAWLFGFPVARVAVWVNEGEQRTGGVALTADWVGGNTRTDAEHRSVVRLAALTACGPIAEGRSGGIVSEQAIPRHFALCCGYLRKVYPEKSSTELEAEARQVWQHAEQLMVRWWPAVVAVANALLESPVVMLTVNDIHAPSHHPSDDPRNGDWHLLGLVFTGTTLKIVVDGAVEGSTACSAAVPGISGTYIDFGWPGTNGSFTNGPDACDFGDPLMYVDAGIDFTDDELAGMYEEFKLTYPLP